MPVYLANILSTMNKGQQRSALRALAAAETPDLQQETIDYETDQSALRAESRGTTSQRRRKR